ncbi:MAG: leucyl aminopeptidase [Planctomycetes bacterium]|nr:leucyl aminopeptidase [Planctomycetota bacterium]
MKLIVKDRVSKLERADALIVFAFEGEKPEFPREIVLSTHALRGFKGEFREHRAIEADSGPITRVHVVGLGKANDFDLEKLRRASAVAAQRVDASGGASAVCLPPKAIEKPVGGPFQAGVALAEGALLGLYRYQTFKTKPKTTKLDKLVVASGSRELRAGLERGRTSAEANAFVRDLQNAPANKMRPRDLVTEAKKLAARSPRIRCKALGTSEMRRHGMGALLCVAQGSVEPPALIHLTYKPRGRAKACIALVGKGLTFDTGGISIKPAARMWDMKYDMSGGAAVLGVFHALAKLDLPLEIHGVVPASENMPGGRAIKPGDVVTAMNGLSIEVLNTDAEGRLVLCDALAYVQKTIEPDTIVDLATLTGAVVVALGHELSGMFASTERLRDQLTRAGELSGERVWPLPLLDAHKDQMKGEVADLKNINSSDSGNGSSAGAAFLAHFVGSTEWCHLDIAGTAWGGLGRDWVGGPQGSGVGTRLLLAWLESRS